MDILETLFSSNAIVKLMRLFLFHPDKVFQKADIINKSKIRMDSASAELNILLKAGMIRKKSTFVESKTGGKRRVSGYILNYDFSYRIPLHDLLIGSSDFNNQNLSKRIGKHGRIKLVVTSGVFIQDNDSRIDLLIVGDNIKERSLKTTIKTIESEIGKQLRYVIFDTKDYRYRVGVCDRLVRDILDYPHQILVNKMGV
ncbi:MAG: hypothetical protein ACI9GH_000119 [Candidatus Paceibacteria bacterium]|jgi:hypothetical protein